MFWVFDWLCVSRPYLTNNESTIFSYTLSHCISGVSLLHCKVSHRSDKPKYWVSAAGWLGICKFDSNKSYLSNLFYATRTLAQITSSFPSWQWLADTQIMISLVFEAGQLNIPCSQSSTCGLIMKQLQAVEGEGGKIIVIYFS